MPTTTAAERAAAELRDYALAFPGAYEEHPWGESAIKIDKRIFVCWSCGAEGLAVSAKLPRSSREALLLPFAEPTHYGMGKHGWVTGRFAPTQEPPLAILRAWIDESFRAIAPKKVVAQLDGTAAQPPERRSRRTR